MKVKIEAVLVKGAAAAAGKKRLKVASVQERETIPDAGEFLTLVYEKRPPKAEVSLRVLMSTVIWSDTGAEERTLFVEGGLIELTKLAVVCGWHVVNGIEDLSPDQQSFIRCEQGTCDDHPH